MLGICFLTSLVFCFSNLSKLAITSKYLTPPVGHQNLSVKPELLIFPSILSTRFLNAVLMDISILSVVSVVIPPFHPSSDLPSSFVNFSNTALYALSFFFSTIFHVKGGGCVVVVGVFAIRLVALHGHLAVLVPE